MIELYAGDLARSEPSLREACNALERMGERDFRSTACAFLARALATMGRDDEAAAWARESRETSAPDDMPSQVTWRSVIALIDARGGRGQEAEALAREAVALAGTSDDPAFTGVALLDLAEVLHLVGDAGGARETAKRAEAAFERKGATALVERARRTHRRARLIGGIRLRRSRPDRTACGPPGAPGRRRHGGSRRTP